MKTEKLNLKQKLFENLMAALALAPLVVVTTLLVKWAWGWIK